MGEIVVFDNLTLDGVMQAPGHPDEDRRGGFAHGGWAAPYDDAVKRAVALGGRSASGALLFGRHTYVQFASVWADGPADNPFTQILNESTKYVASTTLAEPLPWRNSVLLGGDARDAVAELRAQPGMDLVILGSGVLIRSLMERNLIDRFVLPIHPLVLGTGRRLFDDGGPGATLRLVDAKPTTTGVLIATYEPVGAGDPAA